MNTVNKSVSRRWFYLIIGAIALLFAGVIYAWSILKAPIGEALGCDSSALALNFTITMCFFCIGGVVGSLLTKRISHGTALVVAAVCVCVGFVLVGFVSSLIVLYLAYGVLASLGIGIAYNVVISGVSAWFPDKKGTCSGVLMMGFGLSSLLLGKVASLLFSIEEFGWRKTFIVFGAAIAAVLTIAALFIKAPGENDVLPAPKQKKRAFSECFEPKDFTLKEMLSTFSFWRFFVFIILFAAVGSTVISFAKDLALSVGAGDSLASTLVGVLAIFNGLGRIICGLLFDTLGRRKTMIISGILTIAAPAAVLVSVFTHSLVICIAGLCLTGISYGCSPTISSAFTAAFYGTKHFALNYSVANLTLIPASFAATIASSLQQSSGSYAAPFIMLIACGVASLALNLTLKAPLPIRKDKNGKKGKYAVEEQND